MFDILLYLIFMIIARQELFPTSEIFYLVKTVKEKFLNKQLLNAS